MDYPKKLIFLHNFRCSGNVLNQSLKNLYGDICLKNGMIGSKTIHYEEVIKLGNSKKIRLITGHNFYGLHRHFDEPCEYFTNMRKPEERLISGFLGWPEESKSLSNWLSQHPEANNGMVARLCGYGKNKDQWYNYCDNELMDAAPTLTHLHLEKALRVLDEECGMVLFQEYQEESLMLFEQRYNIKPLINIQWAKFNRSTSFLTKQHFKKQDLEQLARQNELDNELYRISREKFESLLVKQPDSFFDKARVRKIFNTVFDLKGATQLDPKEIATQLEAGLNQLYNYGLIEELHAFVELVMQQSIFAAQFRQNLLTMILPLITKEVADNLATKFEICC